MAEKPTLTFENWSEFEIEDLQASPEEKVWNRYVVAKQAELNTMARALGIRARSKTRVDSLCSAVNERCDPLPD